MQTAASAASSLAPEPSSVRAARRAVCEIAGDDADEEALEIALLCTSEIVTNAVEHGEPPIELQVERRGERLRVGVRDRSPLRPRLGDPPPECIRGRGMMIVDRCADRWGVDDDVGEGKVVWFEIAVSA